MSSAQTNIGMNRERFEQIAARFAELEHGEAELRREQFDTLYNTPGNSNHPVAFDTLEDALAHEDLDARIRELELSKRSSLTRQRMTASPASGGSSYRYRTSQTTPQLGSCSAIEDMDPMC